MPGNHLEELVSEWYQFSGYFVRRNVQVGRRQKGGYDCELDIVAFHPGKKHLLHVEPSLDTDSWVRREERYVKKFEAGRKHIPGLFQGLDIPKQLDQVALFVYGGVGDRKLIGGGKILFIREFMHTVIAEVRTRRVAKAAVPEEYPLLRTLQFATEYWPNGAAG